MAARCFARSSAWPISIVFTRAELVTKRPLNKCRSCGHTWYPKGRSVSIQCPRCHSSQTKRAGAGIGGGIVILVLIALVGIGTRRGNPSNGGVVRPEVASQPAETAATTPDGAEPITAGGLPMRHQFALPAASEPLAPAVVTTTGQAHSGVEPEAVPVAAENEALPDAGASPASSDAEGAASTTNSSTLPTRRALIDREHH
jgi:predicted RNA-binding Zn-ribbon protein involved in translation (DUF1610 family)